MEMEAVRDAHSDGLADRAASPTNPSSRSRALCAAGTLAATSKELADEPNTKGRAKRSS
jgi:hypothetical protein